ncbi:oligopeptide transport system ATP-binding protein [Sporobacter termitidis DSM 10068]|uniref:Oligopeptide transport system ATP-binding protein n=1 Tax=Sporobacter termitidis DSM 10068 TaxID=1123282 RepID=A0A1M5XH89_9FIRM|nr:ABC transporter ATP-binding protein [Sporobacter termitidis]SHH99119.1 oligopeptide transport system ATP-binding protein [Sporobacter termitidis DSM 10068]
MIEAARGNIVDIVNLKMYFPVRRGLLKRKIADVKALDDVSFSIRPGETLGLVGESGCGKTTVGRCIVRLYRPTGGIVMFEGADISHSGESDLRQIRRKMALVFQDPYSSLDPRMSSGDIVGEPLKIHHLVKSKKEYDERVAELFIMSGLSPDMTDRYPHEFSGGQRQRLSIARALAGDPSLIVCDEPISALDVSMQAQILNLLQELQSKNDRLSYLFISHDLLAVQYISQRVAVMYLGRVVEISDAGELYANTLHPYSIALLSAQPLPDPVAEEKRHRIILTGDVPTPLNPPAGCAFHPRCPRAKKECSESVPPLRDAGGGHFVACHCV